MLHDSLISSPICRVSLLGPFQMEWRLPSLDANAWQGRTSARSLFLLLVCAPHRCASRRMLAGILWPESEDEHARDSLRSAIKVLSKVLTTTDGQRLLSNQSNGELLRLAGQDLIWSDVDALLSLVEQASTQNTPEEAFPLWQAAAALLRGELLVADRDHEWSSHPWIKARRRQVYAARRQVVRHLSQHSLRLGERDRAESLLITHLTRFPADQDALYRLMKLLIEAEAFQEALVQYHQCERALKEQGYEPAPPLQALAQRLLTLDLTGLAQAKARHLRQSLTTPHPIAELLVVPASFASPLSPQTLLPFSNAIKQGRLEAVQEVEGAASLDRSDIVTRRAVIARLLGIPVPFLALDGYFTKGMADAMHLLEEDIFTLYEDILSMGWDCFCRSKTPQIINTIDAHTNKLTGFARLAPEAKKGQALSLLCRFSQLSTRIAQHKMDEQQAVKMAKQAITIAIELDDAELIASAFYRRGRVYLEYSNLATSSAQKKSYLSLAKNDVDTALIYVKRVRAPLAGNIYLLATEIYTPLISNDTLLYTQCQAWQEQVTELVYGGNIEDDGTFLKLDTTALHHEKAKTLLQPGRLHDAHREFTIAWATLQPNLLTWQMNMYLTQAKLFLAEQDVEASATSGLKAYTLARAIQSHKGEAEAHSLFVDLQRHDATNSFVRDFSRAIGGE